MAESGAREALRSELAERLASAADTAIALDARVRQAEASAASAAEAAEGARDRMRGLESGVASAAQAAEGARAGMAAEARERDAVRARLEEEISARPPPLVPLGTLLYGEKGH